MDQVAEHVSGKGQGTEVSYTTETSSIIAHKVTKQKIKTLLSYWEKTPGHKQTKISQKKITDLGRDTQGGDLFTK